MNLTPIPTFDDVTQLETITLAIAGPGGIMNAQAQALLNRTEWLRARVDLSVTTSDLANSAVDKGAALSARGAQVVATIAALRLLLKTSPSQAAIVKGYYSANDGGGGNYFLDAADTTTLDNGGSVIVSADGARWKLQKFGYIATAQFGIVGTNGGATQLQKCIDAARAENQNIVVNASASIGGKVTIPSPVWKAGLICGVAGVKLTVTHTNDVFIDDQSGGVKFENLEIEGPGSSNVNSWAIKSALGQGWVQGCFIHGFYYGVECTGTTSGVIYRNRFSLNHAGINCVSVSPAFSNILTIRDNYFDFNDFGHYVKQFYALILDSNAYEYNASGAYHEDVRFIDMIGGNWFESNTSFAFQMVGACTGTLGAGTRIVPAAGNNYSIASACSMVDLITLQQCVLGLSSAISVPHNDTGFIVPWTSEVTDPSNLHAAAASSIVVQRPGLYRISVNLELALFASPTSSVFFKTGIRRGGVKLREASVPMIPNQPSQLSISAIAQLAVGDVIQVHAYQNSGVALNLAADPAPSFSVVFLNP